MRLKLSIQPIWLWILLLFNSCSAQEKLVFSDEFEGDELNMEYWSFALGNGCPEICGWGNNEPKLVLNYLRVKGYGQRFGCLAVI